MRCQRPSPIGQDSAQPGAHSLPPFCALCVRGLVIGVESLTTLESRRGWGSVLDTRPGARLCTRRGARAGMQRTEIIHAEQIRLLYTNAPAGFVATVLNVLLLALIQWSVLAPPRILSWLASMLALTALRAVLVWRFQRCAPAPSAMGRWGTLFGLGTFAAGLGWGSAGVWLFPVASIAHQVFLAFVLGGMLAGAVGLLAARMGAV